MRERKKFERRGQDWSNGDMKRVGFITSGGDCQSLNATMRGVAKTLYQEYGKGIEIYGILEGYKGLIYGNYKKLLPKDFSGILNKGGTIIGTSRQPFKQMTLPGENGIDKVKAMKDNYKKMKLDCLVILGGNGTHKTANLLKNEGLNVVTLPKTIDNDIWGTDITFGFQSAVDIATKAIDCIHSTADSHARVFIIEVMGHKVGWMTLHAGIAGGADVILIPEIPYDIDNVIKALEKREETGKRFSILAVAEGAISKEDCELTKKEYKLKYKDSKYPSPAYKIADELQKKTGKEVRVTVPGHMQRGGDPCAYDRVLSTRLGIAAANLVIKEKYGYMVGVKNDEMIKVPLEEVAGKLKKVEPDSPIIKEARKLGICFGN